MSLSTWFTKVVRAVDTEYDRRVRRASNIVAYNTGHEHSEETRTSAVSRVESPDYGGAEEGFEDEGVEVVNVPRGTRV